MKSWAGDIIQNIENSVESKNYKGLKICTVESIKPLVFSYNGVNIGVQFGDVVFVHPLMTGTLINQDEKTLSDTQNFENSTAYNSPNFQATVKGSIPDFIKEFYLFYKNWQSVYLLNIGDLIAVWELEDGGYLVLQKVSLDKLENNDDEKGGEETDEH